ncbi:MAG: hypothetical protein NTY32_04470, partial [Bacteroidia bacterium]|nr:hypothetical protein [Bacteroidia bacterium]
EITIRAEGQTFAIPVEISGLSNTDPVRFRTETLAVLTKQGCNSGSCHGSPEGKGGFALSLFGYDPVADSEQLVRGGLNRRLNLFDAGFGSIIRHHHAVGEQLDVHFQNTLLLADIAFNGASTSCTGHSRNIKLFSFHCK